MFENDNFNMGNRPNLGPHTTTTEVVTEVAEVVVPVVPVEGVSTGPMWVPPTMGSPTPMPMKTLAV